ncbi:MAG: hypothetical protein KJ955_08030 [Nanoarchaeota archaeon]|nr:hypothetical protein [Nanoarchaeota archaeon]
MISKKGSIDIQVVVGVILLLAALIVIGIIIASAVFGVSSTDMKKFSCWASNGMKSSNFVFKSQLPSTCEINNIEEPADVEAIAKMMTETWWMYGKGTWDFGKEDHEIAVFYFEAAKDIKFDEVLNFLTATKDGKRVSDIADSDYNYLAKGSNDPTICTGKTLGDQGMTPTMKKGERYFIMFWDDASILGQGREYGDKVAIAGKPQLGQEGAYYCFSKPRGEWLSISNDNRRIWMPVIGDVSL